MRQNVSEGFEVIEGLKTSKTSIFSASSKIIPIDFQGERIYKLVSTDFLFMSADVSVENPQTWNQFVYLIDFQYTLTITSILKFLENLEPLEFLGDEFF